MLTTIHHYPIHDDSLLRKHVVVTLKFSFNHFLAEIIRMYLFNKLLAGVKMI